MGIDATTGEGLAVFVGSCTLDTIALVRRLPGRDQRVVADDLAVAGGGPAATAAVAYARLGLPAAFVGTVGDDGIGERIRAGLEQEGVDTSGLLVQAGSASGASVITVESEHGTRTICTRPVPPTTVPPGSAAADLLQRARWVHADHLGWPALRELRREGRPGPRLSLDAGNPLADLDLSVVDLYVPTLAGLRRDVGTDDLDDAPRLLRAALDAGAGTVVATRGGAGSVGATRGGAQVQVPGLPVEVCSTLGAGDVFHGALLAAVVRGLPLATACAYAGAVAALSCRGLDGRSAIPDHDTAMASAAVIDPSDQTAHTSLTTGSRQ